VWISELIKALKLSVHQSKVLNCTADTRGIMEKIRRRNKNNNNNNNNNNKCCCFLTQYGPKGNIYS